MGLFEDIGRSNAISQGTSQLVDTALGLRKMQDEQARNDLMNQEARLSIDKTTMELNELKKTRAEMDKPIRVADVLKDTPPSAASDMLQFGKDNGLVKDIGGVLFTTQGDMKRAHDLLSSRADLVGSNSARARFDV